MNWYLTIVEEKLAKPVRHHAMVKAEDKDKAMEIAKDTANSQAECAPFKCRLLSVEDEDIEYRKEKSAIWPNRIETQEDYSTKSDEASIQNQEHNGGEING